MFVGACDTSEETPSHVKRFTWLLKKRRVSPHARDLKACVL